MAAVGVIGCVWEGGSARRLTPPVTVDFGVLVFDSGVVGGDFVEGHGFDAVGGFFCF